MSSVKGGQGWHPGHSKCDYTVVIITLRRLLMVMVMLSLTDTAVSLPAPGVETLDP